MNTEIITFAAEPALTRWVYLKTALIILGIVLLLHIAGQWRTPPLIDYRISMVVCLVLGLLSLYGLTRTPIKEKYSLYNTEQGFSAAQMNEFLEKTKLVATK